MSIALQSCSTILNHQVVAFWVSGLIQGLKIQTLKGKTPLHLHPKMSSLLERVNTKVGHDAVAQAQWTEKRYIWVTDKKEGYLQGSIKKDDGENFDILFDDGSVRVD